MSINKKIYTLVLLLGLSLFTTSCKKYLDVNKNPNVLTNPTPAVLLPSAQIYLATAMGVDFEVNGSIWAQYWTQNPSSSQYRALEQYQPNASTYDYSWGELYTGGENLYQMDIIAKQQNKLQYHAISLLLRAYMFQCITDAWGDVPFSQALKGQAKDSGVVSPHYDMQRAIYSGILGYIDSATAIINPGDPSKPGSDDLMYGGDMTKWQKFANTLKLKVLLRMIRADAATASAGLTALYGSGAQFIGMGDDAQINFINSGANKNPLYTTAVQLGFVQNIVASATCIDQMNNNNDYREYIFYEPASSGAFVGIAQGNYSTQTTIYSIPAAPVAGDVGDANSSTAPVKFITSYESLFLQAEAAARGFALRDDSLYRVAIIANFNSYAAAFNTLGLTIANPGDVSASGDTITTTIPLDASYASYSYLNGDTVYGAPPADWAAYPTSGTLEERLHFIITEKWFSMCGNQGFEAWCEWRRTGYPDFFVVSKNSQIGNTFPRRFIYSNLELTANQNFPGVQPVTSKVWWDVR